MDGQIHIRQMKGIGPKKAERFTRVGIKTLYDALFYFPRSYQDRSKVLELAAIKDGDKATVGGVIESIRQPAAYGTYTKAPMKLILNDGTARGEVVFFNAKYLKDTFAVGEKFWFYGTLRRQGRTCSIQHPEFCKEDEWHKFEGLTPVYPLTEGLTQNDFRTIIHNVLELDIMLTETLPQYILSEMNLLPISEALEYMHRPKQESLAKEARKRFAFEELYLTQLALFTIKRDVSVVKKSHSYIEPDCLQKLFENLPYELTQGQKEVLEDILSDLQSQKLMNRLVQGDVGSGKTVLALAGAYYAAQSGLQTAIMVPTEILARQHFEFFSNYLEPLGVTVRLLVSSQKDKAESLADIQEGTAAVVIGTHAVIQSKVVFKKLGLVITDEQHRFGVRQRSRLAQKAQEHPDILFMSATPIPRTLSLILYGDVDVSFLNEMPAGRLPIKTKYIKDGKRKDMYGFIKEQLKEGRQAYFVCPLVSDSDEIDAISAETHYEQLKTGPFKDYPVGLVHGQMKGTEKEAVMEAYVKGELKILVSTTVIEVGVNVPNSTIMVIEDCQRFGLAQLHQLRGRVGRGSDQSWCFLMSTDPGSVARERIKTLTETNDGLLISQKDLELRGPGEVLGTRQHGLPEMRVANLVLDKDLLKEAQDYALRAFQAQQLTEGEQKFLSQFTMEVSL